uniref:Matrilin 2 n=1 Tax=Scleropages formosus TaxID=113540 RepID=A0A8C9SS88_SCLFO
FTHLYSWVILLWKSPCRGKPMDFVFIIDSSRSVRPRDYEKVKAFIESVLQFLDVEHEATRVGLLQYGSVVQNEFSLKTFQRKEDIQRAVRDMSHLASGTMTGLAIQYAMDVAFTEAEGARPAHARVPRVAMVITDGRPQDTVDEVADRARAAGIRIYAVGVGRVDMNTLRAIGSQPHTEHVYLVANFSQMESLTAIFQAKLCAACAVVEHGCEHICVNLPGSYECRCRNGYELNEDGKSCRRIDYCDLGEHGCEHDCVSTSFICRCRRGYALNPDGKTCTSLDMCSTLDHGCEHLCVGTHDSFVCRCFEGYILEEDGSACGEMDLIFVIDGSKSLGAANFELVKRFVGAIVDFLDVSPLATQVGLLQYSTKVRAEFTLGQFSSGLAVKEAVSRVQYMGRGSMTGSALRHMVELSFSAREGARPGVSRVSIVFTDGRSQDDVSKWAAKAHAAGITMYAVGVGKAIEGELREIASEPDDMHLHYAKDFRRMDQVADKLKSRICAGGHHLGIILISSLLPVIGRTYHTVGQLTVDL